MKPLVKYSLRIAFRIIQLIKEKAIKSITNGEGIWRILFLRLVWNSNLHNRVTYRNMIQKYDVNSLPDELVSELHTGSLSNILWKSAPPETLNMNSNYSFVTIHMKSLWVPSHSRDLWNTKYSVYNTAVLCCTYIWTYSVDIYSK